VHDFEDLVMNESSLFCILNFEALQKVQSPNDYADPQ
jgi:hypothetical protein